VDVGTITLTGGEPLMHPNIKDILEFISEKGNHVHLLTNGIMLNSDNLIKLKKANAELFVTYNEINRKVSQNLYIANKYELEVNLQHVLTKESVIFLDDICLDIKYAKSIILLYPTDLGKGFVKMYDPVEWFSLLEEAINILKSHGILAYFEQAFAKKESHLAKKQPCPTGKDIFVHVDGKFYPCCLLVEKTRGRDNLLPVKMNPKACNFIVNNPLPVNSEYIRICPIVITDRFNGSFNFPSYLGGKK
jgi:MoaA/NifB/PqqE/SkfB family radical SAM enzyme